MAQERDRPFGLLSSSSSRGPLAPPLRDRYSSRVSAAAYRVLFVSSADWVAAPRLPRHVTRAGGRVSALVPGDCWLAASSFVSEVFPGSADADETLDLLRAHLETGHRYDWVVFCEDILLDRAVERAGEPWMAGLLPARAGAERALISKSAFSRAMRACGVPMPAGRAANGPAGIAAAAKEIGYPVIAKPDRGFAGNGLFAADTPEQLAERARAAGGDYIVERLIPGRLGGVVVLFDHGRPAWWSAFLKSGVWPAPFGPSCRRLGLQPGGLEAILEKIGAALGLHGFCGVDWIRGDDGALTVIELNGRPIPFCEVGAHNDPGISHALRDIFAGTKAVRRPPPDDGATLWHMLPASFLLACAEKDYRLAAGLLCGLSGPTDAPWRDPGLMRKYSVRVARMVLRRLLFGRG